jgi:hypothetical protein
MGILFIDLYLYNGATGLTRTGRIQPFTLFGGAVCAEMCQRLQRAHKRRSAPPRVGLHPAAAALLIFQTALSVIRIHNKLEFAGSISEQ